MKPICLNGFVMGLGAAQRTFLPLHGVSRVASWSALSVVLNALSIRIVSRGYKSSIAKEPESGLAKAAL